MANHMWSGPSRALQFHLDLYERLDKVYQHLHRISQDGRVNVHTDTLPTQLTQRLKLMTASNFTDGSTVSTERDSMDRMFDKGNWDRTAMAMKAEFAALNTGETHYVSHSVQQSVLAAAETMDTECLFETDLPCPAGVIVFEYPLMTNDLHPDTGEVVPGLLMPIRAIAWSMSNVMLPEGGVKPGICYSLYTETAAYKDFYCRTYLDILGYDPDSVALMTGADELRSWLTDTSGWAFGVQWDNDKYGEGVSFIRRFLLAYWRWTWQRILVPTPYSPSRAEKKWGTRIRRPLEDGHIKVLRLRREVEHERTSDGEYQGVYDHQFIVRGFWRRQWYATLGPAKIDGEFNPESHRLIWVEPFIKGNPNGPLVVGHNVVAAIR